MRINLLLFACCTLFFGACSKKSTNGLTAGNGEGGLIVGNGTGGISKVERFSHWIVGPRTDLEIKFCVVRSESFPFTEGELRDLILRAFEKWNRLVRESSILYYTDASKISNPAVGAWSDDGRFYLSPAIIIHFAKTCKAGPRDYIIPFYFGVRPPSMNPKLYAIDSIILEASSDSEPFDAYKILKHGYVWVSPPKTVYLPDERDYFKLTWKEPFLLEAALTHEVGHIFGNEEVENTIMDPQIVRKLHPAVQHLSAYTPYKLVAVDPKKFEVAIDHGRRLHTSKNGIEKKIQGTFGNDLSADMRTDLFLRLFGKKPEGVIASFVYQDSLFVSDESGEKLRPIKITKKFDSLASSYLVNSWQSFIINTGKTFLSQYNYSYISTCFIEDANGKKIAGRCLDNAPTNQNSGNSLESSPFIIQIESVVGEDKFPITQTLFRGEASYLQTTIK